MISLAMRAAQDELMDDPSVGFQEFSQTLREIASLNRSLDAYRYTLEALGRFVRRRDPSTGPLRILDIGSGFGDFLRRIAEEAVSRRWPVELVGIDLNPWSEKAAAAEASVLPIRYETKNVFDYRPDKPFHVILSSLMMHHLKDRDIVRLLRWMTDNSLYGWFINDLHRHRAPYYFIRSYVKWRGYNRLVRNDAPLSVARSFTRADWERYVRDAGLSSEQVSIVWRWAFRYVVLYEK